MLHYKQIQVLVHETQEVSMQIQQVIRKVNGSLAFIARDVDIKVGKF